MNLVAERWQYDHEHNLSMILSTTDPEAIEHPPSFSNESRARKEDITAYKRACGALSMECS